MAGRAYNQLQNLTNSLHVLHIPSVVRGSRSISLRSRELNMLRVGLTGGLGSGKTTVAAIFRSLGAHVIDADVIGRMLMEPDQPVYHAIAEHFGPGVLNADGSLNRHLLAELAFHHHRLAELNRIVHPPVIAAQEEWTDRIFALDVNAIAMIESEVTAGSEKLLPVPKYKARRLVSMMGEFHTPEPEGPI